MLFTFRHRWFNSATMLNLTSTQLRKAADLQDQIEKLQTQLAALVGTASKTAPAKPAKKKGGMSAAGKARIAAAQKARWAKIKAAKSGSVVKPAKKKFVMSAAAKAKISAAAKARWAAKKAGQKE